MHFIVETENQLQNLEGRSECFVQVITNNFRYHPKLSSVSLIYYYDFSKGYVICVNHPESLSIEFNKVKDFLSQHKTVYVFDKKWHSYFLDPKNIYDVHYNQLSEGLETKLKDFDTTSHRCMEHAHKQDSFLNYIIPISKHYEKWEKVSNAYEKFMTKKEGILDLSQIYKAVEDSGIMVNSSALFQAYSIENKDCFLQEKIAFTQYNLYNQTGRPTNSFNGVNFLAIPKEEKYRNCFIPRNDYLVEFDFDAYHPRLIAREIGVHLDSSPFHEYMAKLYFDKETIDEKEYSMSKEYTFKQLYGGVMKDWKHIEFFSKMENYVESLWETYNKEGKLTLPTGITVNKSKDLTKYKLFNYFIQNLETKNNYDVITKLLHILDTKISRLVLVTYDSFLIDYSLEDGKALLTSIKNTLSKQGMPVKHKYGKNYYF